MTAASSARELSFQRNSRLAALEQALRLVSSGMDRVRIVDSLGRSHTPAELSLAVFEPEADRAEPRRAA